MAPSNFLQALPENGAEAAGGVSEEKVLLAESRRESQVSQQRQELLITRNDIAHQLSLIITHRTLSIESSLHSK